MTDVTQEPTTWQDYEQVSRHILEQMNEVFELGLKRVEGKQRLLGISGVVTEIDAKGVKLDDGTVIIECRQKSKRLDLDAVRAIAYKIKDLGGSEGIIVSPLKLQKGGSVLAAYENIKHVILERNSTTTDFRVQFLDQVVFGRSVALHASGTLKVDAKVLPGPGQSESDVPPTL
jgi:hypothetical protein